MILFFFHLRQLRSNMATVKKRQFPPSKWNSAEYRCENVDGISLSALKSGMQKGIRRGDVELALRSTRELLKFADPELFESSSRCKGILTNVLHRIMVTFLEDCGQEQEWARVDVLLERAFGPPKARLAAPDAAAAYELVALLATMPKSRMGSHARAASHVRLPGSARQVAQALYPGLFEQMLPKVAKDATPAGLRRLLKAKDPAVLSAAFEFVQRGQKCKTPYGTKPVWSVFDCLVTTAATPAEKQVAELGLKWAKHDLGNLAENFLCWLIPMLRRLWPAPQTEPVAVPKMPVPNGPLALPDYVYDQHVDHNPKNYARFALEGSAVKNEDPTRVRPAWKAFYVDLKFLQAGKDPIGPERYILRQYGDLGAGSEHWDLLPEDVPVAYEGPESRLVAKIAAQAPEPEKKKKNSRKRKTIAQYFGAAASKVPAIPVSEFPAPVVPMVKNTKESAAFQFEVRAQLTTGRAKTDVYFAKDAEGRRVVVKGPFVRKDDPERAVAMMRWKAKHGLPVVPTVAAQLVPDRWASVPLGVRNSLPRDVAQPFLLSQSLMQGELPVKTHSSKLWPETEVVDWKQLRAYEFKDEFPDLTKQEKLDYMAALLLRYVTSIGDLATRNFVRCGGRVLSLDEDGLPNSQFSFATQLPAKRRARARQWLQDLWPELSGLVRAWDVPGINADGAAVRLAKLQAAEDAPVELF